MAAEDESETSFPVFREVAEGTRRAPVTTAFCILIVALFGLIRSAPDPREALVRFGYRTAFQVWWGAGSAWSLIASSFLHMFYWHVGVNILCLWPLGAAVEKVVGPLRMVLLVLGAALASAALQLAMFGAAGYGASGIVYALFGFAWVARGKYPSLKAALSGRRIYAYVVWMVLGFLVAIRTIGNGAHLGGLVWGACAALPFLFERRKLATRSAVFLAVLLAGALGTVCPWWPLWWAAQGYREQGARDYAVARKDYETSLRMSPNSWVAGALASLSRDGGAESTDSGRRADAAP